MSSVLALGKQRQEDHCAFKTSLIYIVSSRTDLHRETLSQKIKK